MAKGNISLSLVVLQGSNPDRKSTNNKQREIVLKMAHLVTRSMHSGVLENNSVTAILFRVGSLSVITHTGIIFYNIRTIISPPA